MYGRMQNRENIGEGEGKGRQCVRSTSRDGARNLVGSKFGVFYLGGLLDVVILFDLVALHTGGYSV